jgi:hypothetical protein
VLLTSDILARIQEGSVTLAFRRWTRPTVRAGGTLMTYIGQLEITSVTIVEDTSITDEEARRAGYPSREDLLDELSQRKEGAIYRVEFGGISPDPRMALREALPDELELVSLLQKLRKLDASSQTGPWTESALALIGGNPGVLAAILAGWLRMDKLDFKARIRKLKALGLTISLEKGYRLSERGEFVLLRLVPREAQSELEPDSNPSRGA